MVTDALSQRPAVLIRRRWASPLRTGVPTLPRRVAVAVLRNSSSCLHRGGTARRACLRGRYAGSDPPPQRLKPLRRRRRSCLLTTSRFVRHSSCMFSKRPLQPRQCLSSSLDAAGRPRQRLLPPNSTVRIPCMLPTLQRSASTPLATAAVGPDVALSRAHAYWGASPRPRRLPPPSNSATFDPRVLRGPFSILADIFMRTSISRWRRSGWQFVIVSFRRRVVPPSLALPHSL